MKIMSQLPIQYIMKGFFFKLSREDKRVKKETVLFLKHLLKIIDCYHGCELHGLPRNYHNVVVIPID